MADIVKAVAERMQAERRRREATFVDLSSLPEQLHRLIEAGKVGKIVTFYHVDQGSDQPPMLSMFNGGFTIPELYETVCVIKDQMEQTMGFGQDG